MSRWRALRQADLPALRGLLARREWACCSLSSRLLSAGKPRIPPPRSSRLFGWIPERGRSAIPPQAGGLLLLSPPGNLYPCLPDCPPGEDRELAALAGIDTAALSACIGLSEDVARMEAALGLASAESNDYFLMVLEGLPAPGASAPPEPGLSAFKPRRADAEAVFPLQAAYEKEEVLASIHRHDPKACRAALAASIDDQEMLCARLSGRIVAKAQTNARGMLWDQLGGIYVEPGLRGRGIGTWLVAALCAELASKGRKLTLFVKKKNTAAIASYRKIGFAFRDSFRISYYS